MTDASGRLSPAPPPLTFGASSWPPFDAEPKGYAHQSCMSPSEEWRKFLDGDCLQNSLNRTKYGGWQIGGLASKGAIKLGD